MAIDRIKLKALALEFAAALPPPPPREVELILSSGETLTREAMNLARFYDAATPRQRRALDAMLAAFGCPG